MASTHMRIALKWAAGALGVAAGAYGGYARVTWLRYGHTAPASADDAGGWGPAIIANFLPLIWFLVVSVWMMRRRETAAAQGAVRTLRK